MDLQMTRDNQIEGEYRESMKELARFIDGFFNKDLDNKKLDFV
jgi:hypothetical protein